MATRFCTQCGQAIPENSKFCVNCGTPVPAAPNEPLYAQQQPQPQPQPQTPPRPTTIKPKNYLVMAILSTIFCCLPFGIVSIVFAAKVDNYWNAGDYINAEDASRKARGWMIASIITGLTVGIIYTVLIMIGAFGTDFLDNFS